MPRTFIYARISSTDRTTANQVAEIRAAGFDVDPKRIVEETISGSVAAKERPGFLKLMDRMEAGDVLVITKLDRLGRDAIDVGSTVRDLSAAGIRVHCLALGGVDLTSSAGAMTMNVLNAVAQFERDLIIERTRAGLERAKAEGKHLGRPPALTDDEKRKVLADLAAGASVSATARKFNVTRQSIIRARKAAGELPAATVPSSTTAPASVAATPSPEAVAAAIERLKVDWSKPKDQRRPPWEIAADVDTMATAHPEDARQVRLALVPPTEG